MQDLNSRYSNPGNIWHKRASMHEEWVNVYLTCAGHDGINDVPDRFSSTSPYIKA